MINETRNDLYCLKCKTVKKYNTNIKLFSSVRSFFFFHLQHTKVRNTPLNIVDIIAIKSKTERSIAVFSFFAEL